MRHTICIQVSELVYVCFIFKMLQTRSSCTAACTKRTGEPSALDSSPILKYASKRDCFRRRSFTAKTALAHILVQLWQCVRGLSLPGRAEPQAARGRPAPWRSRMAHVYLVPLIVATNHVGQVRRDTGVNDYGLTGWPWRRRHRGKFGFDCHFASPSF